MSYKLFYAAEIKRCIGLDTIGPVRYNKTCSNRRLGRGAFHLRLYLSWIEGPPPKRTNYGSLKEAAWDNFVKFKI